MFCFRVFLITLPQMPSQSAPTIRISPCELPLQNCPAEYLLAPISFLSLLFSLPPFTFSSSDRLSNVSYNGDLLCGHVRFPPIFPNPPLSLILHCNGNFLFSSIHLLYLDEFIPSFSLLLALKSC